MGGKKGGEMGVVRDIPSDYYSATWVFPCFNKAEFRHFKELTPHVPCSELFDPTLMKKTAPAGEKGRPGTYSCCSPPPCRRVRWLPAHHSSAPDNLSPSANSFKQNKHSVFMQAGCSLLWKEFYFPNSKPCATRTVGNVCSNNRKLAIFPLLERGCSS